MGNPISHGIFLAAGIIHGATASAGNTHEKLLAHQIAVAHKVALEQAAAADRERDTKLAIKRLQVSARMMATSQQAMLTLQKLKVGTNHTVVVQHVSVSGYGQAVIGNVDRLPGLTPATPALPVPRE